MNSTQVSQAELAELIAMSKPVYTFRYMTAAGLTLFLYDSFMNFGDELELMWMQPWNNRRVAFLFTRYLTMGILTLTAYATSGLSNGSTSYCKGWGIITAIGIVICFLINNYILVVHLYSLYDHRKSILRILLCACGVANIVATVFVVLSFIEVVGIPSNPNVVWDPIVYGMCIFSRPIRFSIGVWLLQVAFELFAFILTILNAAERPRRAQSKLISDLNRDGMLNIVVLFIIRVANLVLAGQQMPAYQFMTGFFTLAVTILSLTRLVLRVERMRYDSIKSTDLVTAMEFAMRGFGTDSHPRVIIDTITTTVVL